MIKTQSCQGNYRLRPINRETCLKRKERERAGKIEIHFVNFLALVVFFKSGGSKISFYIECVGETISRCRRANPTTVNWIFLLYYINHFFWMKDRSFVVVSRR